MINIQYNIDLKAYHTFAISQKAAALFTYETTAELVQFFTEFRNKFKRILPIGEGSNMLFINDFDGCLLKSHIRTIEIVSQNHEFATIKVGSGLNWDDFVAWSIEHNFYGLENLSLIPGTVGASAVQNIGAYGIEAAQVIDKVEGFNIQTYAHQTFNNSQCSFGYRSSVFKNELQNKFVITHVHFKLALKPNYRLDYGAVKQEVENLGEVTLQHIRAAIIKIREEKLPDPKIMGNAGSFFKNPVVESKVAQKLLSENPGMPYYTSDNDTVKLAAGWLIDQCGLKGYKNSDGAAVHNKQALVLTNCGVKSGRNILELANYIKEKVYQKFAINLEPEVTIIE